MMIWPFEAVGFLGTVAAFKAPRGLGGLSFKTKVCFGSPLE